MVNISVANIINEEGLLSVVAREVDALCEYILATLSEYASDKRKLVDTNVVIKATYILNYGILLECGRRVRKNETDYSLLRLLTLDCLDAFLNNEAFNALTVKQLNNIKSYAAKRTAQHTLDSFSQQLDNISDVLKGLKNRLDNCHSSTELNKQLDNEFFTNTADLTAKSSTDCVKTVNKKSDTTQATTDKSPAAAKNSQTFSPFMNFCNNATGSQTSSLAQTGSGPLFVSLEKEPTAVTKSESSKSASKNSTTPAFSMNNSITSTNAKPTFGLFNISAKGDVTSNAENTSTDEPKAQASSGFSNFFKPLINKTDANDGNKTSDSSKSTTSLFSMFSQTNKQDTNDNKPSTNNLFSSTNRLLNSSKFNLNDNDNKNDTSICKTETTLSKDSSKPDEHESQQHQPKVDKNDISSQYKVANPNELCNEEELKDFQWILPTIAKLEQVEENTGEDNETVMFESRSKLYRFRQGVWKSCGLGIVRLLQDDKKRTRCVFRNEVTSKILSNSYLPITNDQDDVIKQRADNSKFSLWSAYECAGDIKENIQMGILLKTDELAEQFRTTFKACSLQNSEIAKTQ